MSNEKYGVWQIKKSIGNGGSGDVFKVINTKNNMKNMVLKKLNDNSKKYDKIKRFDREIEILNFAKKNNILGVVDIEDYYTKNKILSENFDDQEYWYVMPMGKGYFEHIKEHNLKIDMIINDFLKLIETLIELHKNKITHRDIKPENIIWINDRLTFIDFGIAKDLNDINHGLTMKYDAKQLGAKFTRAPEMIRSPKDAEYFKADIYSLMKTLWIFLTGDKYSFDGQYKKENRNHSLRFLKNINTNEDIFDITSNNYRYDYLDEILTKATDDDPQRRPDLNEIKEQLTKFIKAEIEEDLCINALNYTIGKITPNIFEYDISYETINFNKHKYEEDVKKFIIPNIVIWKGKISSYACYLLMQKIMRNGLDIINMQNNEKVSRLMHIEYLDSFPQYITIENTLRTVEIDKLEYIFEMEQHFIILYCSENILKYNITKEK